MIATHLPEEAPALDLLMIPGGGGNRGNETDWIIDFVKSRFDSIDYIASVCTGSLLLAKSSVLDNKRATTNKAAWNNIVGHGPNVNWVPNARWTQDGNIWTSSGVAAGMDITYALLSWMYGSQKINETMNSIELTTLDPSIGAQAASAGIQAAKSLIGKKVKLVKVTLRAGYQLLLKQTN